MPALYRGFRRAARPGADVPLVLCHRIVPDEQPRGERESVVRLLLFLGVVPSRTDDGIGYKRKKKMRRARARDDDDDTILSEGDLKVRSPWNHHHLYHHHIIASVVFQSENENVPSLRRQSIFACVRIFPRGVPVDLTERLAPRRRTVMMIPMLHLFVSPFVRLRAQYAQQEMRAL